MFIGNCCCSTFDCTNEMSFSDDFNDGTIDSAWQNVGWSEGSGILSSAGDGTGHAAVTQLGVYVEKNAFNHFRITAQVTTKSQTIFGMTNQWSKLQIDRGYLALGANAFSLVRVNSGLDSPIPPGSNQFYRASLGGTGDGTILDVVAANNDVMKIIMEVQLQDPFPGIYNWDYTTDFYINDNLKHTIEGTDVTFIDQQSLEDSQNFWCDVRGSLQSSSLGTSSFDDVSFLIEYL